MYLVKCMLYMLNAKVTVDIIDLEDIRERIDGTYNVKVEAIPEFTLNNGEKIGLRVYYTVPRKDGEDASTPHIHYITGIAALLLSDMVRAGKCSTGRF